MHDLVCERPFKTRLFSMSEIYNQFRGSGNDRKIKVAVEGIKLTTGFLEDIDQNVYFLKLASRKSRTPRGRPKILDLF